MPADGTLALPENVIKILALLEAAGFQAYVVGGCVRDALLGKIPEDWDICTAAQPGQVMEALQGIPVLETGLQHGTVTAILDRKPFEITTFRLDGAYSDHRRPDSVTFTGDLAADLSRRDFIMNAMAYHPSEGLVDPFGGTEDLQAGIIRCVGAPQRRFEEDALRILRCLRFASTLNFSIEENTARQVRLQCESLRYVAAERVQKELTNLLRGQNARRVLLEFSDVVFTILPQLRPLRGFDQRTPWHCYDIWEHSCAALEAIPPEPALRWAALLHDCGKPDCFFLRDGVGHFHGHPAVSERMARELLSQLKCPRRLTEHVVLLIKNHELRLLDEPQKPARLKRLLGALGEQILLELLALMRADILAQAPEKRYRLEGYEALRSEIIALARQNSCVTRAQLAVNGNDLLPLGLQGPQLGKMLDRLLEEVIEGRLENRRESLLAWAQLHKN